MKRKILALTLEQAMQLFAEPCVVIADNVVHAPMQTGAQATKPQISPTVNKEGASMAKNPKIKLVLVHVELEGDCPNLEKLAAGRIHTIDGVSLATPVAIAGDSFVADLPGGAFFTCASLEDLEKVSFK